MRSFLMLMLFISAYAVCQATTIFFLDANYRGDERDTRQHRMVEAEPDENEAMLLSQSASYFPTNLLSCMVFGDNYVIKEKMKRVSHPNVKVWYLNRKAMNDLIAYCDLMSSKGFTIRTVEESKQIVPGTKWCGPGNVALHYNEVGVEQDTDKCCRSHDLCPNFIPPGETDVATGLHNSYGFLVIHCSCDEEFRKCLQQLKRDKFAQGFAQVHFNLMDAPCFKKEYPIVACKKYASTSSTTGNNTVVVNSDHCAQYELDTTQKKVWQFFDSPVY